MDGTYVDRIRFGDTLRHDALVALFVTCVAAVFALVSDSVQEEVAAERTEHQLVELGLHELVSVHLVYISLAFADGALTA